LAAYAFRKMQLNKQRLIESSINDQRDVKCIAAHEIGHEVYAPRGRSPNGWSVVEIAVMADAIEQLGESIDGGWNEVHEYCNIVDDEIVNCSLVFSPQFKARWGNDLEDGFCQDKFPMLYWMMYFRSNGDLTPTRFHALIMVMTFDKFKNGGQSLPTHTMPVISPYFPRVSAIDMGRTSFSSEEVKLCEEASNALYSLIAIDNSDGNFWKQYLTISKCVYSLLREFGWRDIVNLPITKPGSVSPMAQAP